MAGHVFMIRQESAPPAPPWWFLSLVFLGAAYVATVTLRLLAYLAFSLHRQPKDLRSRYGAWAVITGPTSGMGRAMALELARRGLNLVLVGRDPANLEEISNTVRSLHGVETKTVVFDLSLVATPHGDEPLRQLRETVEGLDVGVLMNNAGVGEPAMAYLHEADVEAWVRMMRVNLWAVTEVTAAVLPGMVERGRGAVVNIGSASSQAIPSFPLCTIYSATKRHVRGSFLPEPSPRAPFFVATRMVENLAEARRLSPFTVTPGAYARARRWGGSAAAARFARRTSGTGCCGAPPPPRRTPCSTGSSCAATWSRGRRCLSKSERRGRRRRRDSRKFILGASSCVHEQ
ncbi:Os06g0298700 [Oryza sativa Japonica Group]|uniref:Os06g0298700 protein n=1 Tax=Oryza sativa subsp. japonica TaxID=39947 RepID=Q0DCR5_ORYSJ|nr:Os06g0298700 [Oryza sativa Japonica Group]|eukprot:NP_001057444.2 Os06g0298700 [Oryza sativa Japonica Group]